MSKKEGINIEKYWSDYQASNGDNYNPVEDMRLLIKMQDLKRRHPKVTLEHVQNNLEGFFDPNSLITTKTQPRTIPGRFKEK